jgi:phytoene/squalene synthetase
MAIFTQGKTPGVSRADVKEIVDELLRTAMREQARDLETHLKDIDRRLKELEKHRR